MQFPSKIPTQFFADLERTIINFIWKNKKTRITKIISHTKGAYRVITTPDIKLSYKPTVIKTTWYWHKTEMLTNGIELKTQILIHTPMNT